MPDLRTPIITTAAILAFAAAAVVRAADPVELPVGDAKVFSLMFSPDGKQLAVGTGGQAPTVKLFDIAAKKVLCEIPCSGRGAAFSTAFSRDGKLLAIGDYDLAVTVRNAADGSEIASLPGDPERKKYRQARRVAFPPDGKQLVAGYSTGEIFVWDIAEKKIARQFDHGHEITALAVSSDGKLIATGTNFGLRLWNAADGKPVVSLDQKGSATLEVQAVAISPDGKTVVTADSPGFVRFFATADGQDLRKFQMPAVGKETTVYGVGITSDGKTVVAPGLLAGLDPKRPRSLDTGILLIDFASARPRAFLPSITAHVQAVSPDGKTVALATGDSGDPVFLYNLTTATPVK